MRIVRMKGLTSLAAAVAVMLTVSLAGPAAGSGGGTTYAADGASQEQPPRRPKDVRSVEGKAVKAEPAPRDAEAGTKAGRAAAVRWPRPGTAEMTIGKKRPAGSPPISVTEPRTRDAPGPGRVRVRVHDRGAAGRAGVDGVLFSLSRTDGGTAARPVRVTVDYSGFRDAYGGDWSSRLRLAPQGAAADRTVTAVRHDLRAGRVSADVMVGETEGTFSLGAAPEGPAGDYTATSLSPSGKWQVSPHTGAFTWSYDLRVPPAPGGLEPDLALSYNSQSVDGRTVSTNNQPSWAGEGWDLWPGFIERSYKGCADDLGVKDGPGDMCWGTLNASLAMADHTGELVHAGGGGWRPKKDDGTRVEHLTGKANGDQGGTLDGAGEYWKVTTTDGTRYFFGQTAASAWTVPVFGDDSGEPCHAATFAASHCTQVYRWNLDHVVDRHGNTIDYIYHPEKNRYGLNKASGVAEYVRGGTLKEIRYGARAGQPGQAPARVVFESAERCADANCTVRPDVPKDLDCQAATCPNTWSPTFWTTKRLKKITTQISTGTGYRSVDQWDFTHAFPPPGDGTSAALWLNTITHSGLGAQPYVTLPAVNFDGTQHNNRVFSDGDRLPQLNKYRITTIKTEYGGAINVKYAAPDCAAGSTPPAADTNVRRCFPVRWAMPPSTVEADDWFHKYVVEAVAEDDLVGGNPDMVTRYEYVGGGAWAYDDNPLVKPERRTWSQWRGYGKVIVRDGNPATDDGKKRSVTEHRYFRGMHGDRLASGGTKTATVGGIDDIEPLAGFVREKVVRDGDGGPEVSGEVGFPWTRLTATQGTRKAYQVENARTDTRTRLSNGSYRVTRVDTSYDEHGNPTKQYDRGDTAVPSDDQCTTTSYAKNTDAWIVDLPSREKTVGVACDATPAYPDDAISDARTYYDDRALGAAPTKGNATKTEKAKSYSGATPVYLTTERAAYDGYGRKTESIDALGRRTVTSHTQTNGLTTATTETNPAEHSTTTALDPAWGQRTRVTDPNDRVASLRYDALGRVTDVWKPGRSRAAGTSPHLRFAYGVRTNGPNYVKTETIKAGGNHVPSYELLDGFLRPRQTQAPSPHGGRILTDTLHDSRGLKNVTREPYHHQDAGPGTTLFQPNAGEVPSSTVAVYDGAERQTESIHLESNDERWRTTTVHGGDRVKVIPPAGGTVTTTLTDARGRKTEVRQHKSRSSAESYDSTKYAYTKSGEVASMTDPAGNVWRYDYDVLGRKTRADDPDKGVSRMIYDDAGQLTSATDARGKTVVTEYDALGRKTKTRLGSSGGPVVAEWAYDTLAKGQPTSATRIEDGHRYTKSVLGYDAAGRATGETVAIPSAEDDLGGTYTTRISYATDGRAPTDDSIASITLPKLGDVDQETLVYEYDDLGLRDKVTGRQAYLTGTKYTKLGEPAELMLGVKGKRLQQNIGYDPGTRRVTQRLTQMERRENEFALADVTHYGYDPTGNITKISDRTTGSEVDNQCFRYDHLRRATEAWTTAATDCPAEPSPSAIGGPAAYWQRFTYDATGNRRTRTTKGLAGAPDTVSTYDYPESGEEADRPHAVTAVRTGTKTDAFTYDAAGNTRSRPGASGAQSLTWDDEGMLASIEENSKKTRYTYDADGNQLLRRDPGSTTLFLEHGEVRLDTAANTVAGTRYTEFGARTPAGFTWTIADHHGTPRVAIDASTMSVTPRRTDLFGDPRGSQPSSWPGERAFVGGTKNEVTGLTRLGAREYDPAQGKFVSVDPVIDPEDPQQFNAYSYANNSPAGMSDPDGKKYFVDVGGHVSVPSVKYITPAILKRAAARVKKLYAGYYKRRQAVSRAAQHDWNAVDGKRGRVGGYGKRAQQFAALNDVFKQMGDRLPLGSTDRIYLAAQLLNDMSGGLFKSFSICGEAEGGAIVGVSATACANFDQVGMTTSVTSEHGLEFGADVDFSVSLKLNTKNAAKVNAKHFDTLTFGLEGGLGHHVGMGIEKHDTHNPGLGQLSVYLKYGGGFGGSIGSYRETDATYNSGYLVRWCADGCL